jgi:3-phosphoglycerate kinase
MAIRYLSEASPKKLRGTALLRLDFNTKDDWRMRAVLPTLTLLAKRADKIVVISHRGRPRGAEKKFSLRHDAADLSRLIKRKVVFIDHFRFGEIKAVVAAAPRGTVFLLENLRFMKGEEANDPRFARALASIADYYVNDAFAVSHRANASVAAITKFLPSYAGLEMENEIVFLSRVMQHPVHPLVVVLGGAKAADKLGVIKYFKKKTDWFLLGGGPANTILSLRGVNVKKSVRDRDPKDLKTLAVVAAYGNLELLCDFVWHGDMIWDIGPATIKQFSAKIAGARTILWSGPLGLIEKSKYAKGSVAIARAIVRNRHAFSVAGGGETVMFLKKYGLDRRFSFISTGGGAMMDFLAGKKLPGIEALK